jgi:cold shock CspA family protein
MSTAIRRGKVSFVAQNGDYGFIIESLEPSAKGHSRINTWFWHMTGCLCEIHLGDPVVFSVGQGRKGPMAVDVNIDTATAEKASDSSEVL